MSGVVALVSVDAVGEAAPEKEEGLVSPVSIAFGADNHCQNHGAFEASCWTSSAPMLDDCWVRIEESCDIILIGCLGTGRIASMVNWI
jgi:hypothetical protein